MSDTQRPDTNAPGSSRGGPPPIGMAGARVTSIDPALVQAASNQSPFSRAIAGVRRMLGMDPAIQAAAANEVQQAEASRPLTERPVAPTEVNRTTASTPGTTDGWFGPGVPMAPVAPREDVAGRAWDFPAGYNLQTTPRRYEGISFSLLRGLADWDLLRLAIETRKDQLARVKWHILPKKPPGQKHNTKPDETCAEIEKFFRKPDGVLAWDQWVRSLAEDSLVLDAVALYRRKRKDGTPYSLDILDGSTVNLLIDVTGRRPLPPNPAYQQILKGMPAVEFTSQEITYSVRNPRPHKAYGQSPVEQIVTYVNIGLRRMTKQLQTYTEGNVPEALMSVPDSWSVVQIQQFQSYWDAIMENAANRRRMKFVPSGMNYWPTHPDQQLLDQFDEWLARIVAYAFSLPPTPFVRQMNRATAESAYQTALEEGLEPMLMWLKNIIDGEIEEFLGHPGYELIWDDIRKLDPAEKQNMDLADIARGVKSIDEVRAERGDEPLGLPHIFWGMGPMGFMSLGAVKKAIEMGLDMPQPPPPPDTGVGGMPGEDPLAGADPALLQQLGIDPGQGGGPPGAPPGGQMMMQPPPNPMALLRRAKGSSEVASVLRGLGGGGPKRATRPAVKRSAQASEGGDE